MVVVGILVVSMIVIMPRGSFAKPTVRAGMMVICKISSSVLETCIQPEERETNDGLSVLG